MPCSDRDPRSSDLLSLAARMAHGATTSSDLDPQLLEERKKLTPATRTLRPRF